VAKNRTAMRSSSGGDRATHLATVRDFEGLSNQALEAIAEEMEGVNFPAGGELCREHDLPGLLVIRYGSVSVSTLPNQMGVRFLVGELGPGDNLGVLSLVGLPATNLVEGLAPLSVLRLNHSGFERAAEKFPEIRSRLEAMRDHLQSANAL
jgi:CRP-like cAMP-binding protein